MKTKMYIKSQQYLKLQQREKGVKLWIPSYNSAILATCEKYDEESVKRFARKMIVMQLFYLQWSSFICGYESERYPVLVNFHKN